MTMKNKFWNVKTDGNKSQIDLFGYVGGSKGGGFFAPDGFNEKELLKELREIPTDNAIDISINSFGGSVYTALSIYSLLKAHKGAITFRVDGAAMSAATIITSAPNAKVIMPKGSMMMIHKVSSVAVGNTDDFRKAADDIEKLEGNIISIYAEKTGKSADEIREKVNAETYFTAEEAVEFGLADEIDESRTVENIAQGDIVMLNGLSVSASLFAGAPAGFIKADSSSTSAANDNPEEVENMDLVKLKADYPELYEAIRAEAFAEGTQKERERIKAIEEIAVAGHEALVNKAKFDNAMTAEQLAVAILKADRQRNEQMIVARQADADQLAGINAEGNMGIAENNGNDEQKKTEHLANFCKYKGGK